MDTQLKYSKQILFIQKIKKMKQQDYTATIEVNGDTKEAFQKISKVDEWWAKTFKGKALQKGDHFRVEFGDTTVDFDIKEAVPDKKIIWHVSDCYLPFLNDKTEWTGTEVVWEISPKNRHTEIKMTHVGLSPDAECFEVCQQGWNKHIKSSLVNLINENKGMPQ
ncbi:MAG: ATPase [Bacteroidetes bacterium]|nr:MAG: ATPase [Bacteroidota bacterium]